MSYLCIVCNFMAHTSASSVVASATLIKFMTVFAWNVTADGIVKTAADGDTGGSRYVGGKKGGRWLKLVGMVFAATKNWRGNGLSRRFCVRQRCQVETFQR